MVPCKSTAKEVSFEWLHHRILSTDSKVRTTLHVSMIDFGSEKVKCYQKEGKCVGHSRNIICYNLLFQKYHVTKLSNIFQPPKNLNQGISIALLNYF